MASAGLINGSTTLTVTGPALVSLAVAPVNPLVAPGLSIQFTTTGRLSDGSTQDLTKTVTWASWAAGVATINSIGLAAGIGTGSTTIQATFGSISNSTTLTVMPLFTVTGSMTVARVSHTATMLNNGKVLITAGYNSSGGSSLASAELYDPANRRLSALRAACQQRGNFTRQRC